MKTAYLGSMTGPEEAVVGAPVRGLRPTHEGGRGDWRSPPWRVRMDLKSN